jgi:hypothetical protein
MEKITQYGLQTEIAIATLHGIYRDIFTIFNEFIIKYFEISQRYKPL